MLTMKNMVMAFKVGMGAEAIKALLKESRLRYMTLNEINKELETAQGQKRIRLLKRLDVLECFLSIRTINQSG